MNAIFRCFSILALSFLLGFDRGQCQDDSATKTGTLAEQYAALMRAYRPDSSGIRDATNDRERRLAVERFAKWPEKFLDFADRNSNDPIALKALTQAIQTVNSTDSAAQNAWELNQSGTDLPAGSSPEMAGRAIKLLRRDHADSEALGRVCERIRYGYRMEYEEYLRTVVRDSPHREVQALACLSVAQFLNERLRMLHLAADRPDLTRRFEAVLGKDYLPGLQKRGTAELSRQAESFFEQAATFDEVKTARGVTVAEQATQELYDLRHLAVGRQAPDIEGRDQDDRPLKLSDYRGKVVLLYFWVEF
jgi:hypothetical protein